MKHTAHIISRTGPVTQSEGVPAGPIFYAEDLAKQPPEYVELWAFVPLTNQTPEVVDALTATLTRSPQE